MEKEEEELACAKKMLDNVREAADDEVPELEHPDPKDPSPEGGNPEKDEEDHEASASAGGKRKCSKKKSSEWSEMRSEKVICDECGAGVTLGYLQTHKRRKHDPNFTKVKCPRCPLEFTRSSTLWAHVTSKHWGWEGLLPQKEEEIPPDHISSKHEGGGGGVCCSLCGQLFSSVNSLKRHEQFVHGDGAKPESNLQQCPHCPKSFKQKATLDDHIRRTHEGKGFFCDLCPSRADLQSAGKLWKHKVDYHGLTDLPLPEGLQLLQCQICGERMFRHLEAHIKKAHPEVDISQIQFTKAPRSSTTTTTTNSQTEEPPSGKKKLSRFDEFNPSQCPHCGKTLNTLNTLKRHLKNVHSIGNVKIYPCPTCAKEFRLRYHLNQHLREHERDQINNAIHSVDFIQLERATCGGKLSLGAFCLVCDSKFGKNLADTRTHLAVEHPQVYQVLKNGESAPPSSTSTLIQCKACPQKLPISELRLHLESTHERKCWRCPKCDKVMLSSGELSFHFKFHHQKEKEKPPRITKNCKKKPKNNRREELITTDTNAVDNQEGIGKRPRGRPVGWRKVAGDKVEVAKNSSPGGGLRKSTRKRQIKKNVAYQYETETSSSSSSSSSSEDDEEDHHDPSSKNKEEEEDSTPIPAFAVKREIIFPELKECRVRLVRLSQQEIAMHTSSSRKERNQTMRDPSWEM